jgi:very-short-patch-repair endonuclease
MQISNPKELKEKRKGLRNNLSPAEAILWNQIKNNKLGVKFRRQHGIGSYILDFYCSKCKLCIELDGGTHDNEKAYHYDQNRSSFIENCDIKVIRFLNNDVYKNLDGVLIEIKKYLI